MRKSQGTRTQTWRESDLGACACSQLRRTARAASNVYDRYLAPVGLTVTQYAVLVNIGRAERIRRTDLAAELGMDRTTLTRNLRPLETRKLLESVTGDDRREKLLQLTSAGVKRLEASYPLWAEAQRYVTGEIGERGLSRLRAALGTVSKALGEAGKRVGQ
jgi:DNA-binding MarR family transcriptional regulator